MYVPLWQFSGKRRQLCGRKEGGGGAYILSMQYFDISALLETKVGKQFCDRP